MRKLVLLTTFVLFPSASFAADEGVEFELNDVTACALHAVPADVDITFFSTSSVS